MADPQQEGPNALQRSILPKYSVLKYKPPKHVRDWVEKREKELRDDKPALQRRPAEPA